jgi:hypothetical protein
MQCCLIDTSANVTTAFCGSLWIYRYISHTNLLSLPNIIRAVKSRKMRYAGHVARTGDRRGAYRVLVGRLEGMIKTGKPGLIWDDNIKMNPQELGQGEQGLGLSGSG